MRFDIGGRNLQRLFGRRHRVAHAVLPHVERGKLGGDIGGRRLKRRRALERRDCAFDVVFPFQTTCEQILVVGFCGLRRLRRSGGRRAAWLTPALSGLGNDSRTSKNHDEHAELHEGNCSTKA